MERFPTPVSASWVASSWEILSEASARERSVECSMARAVASANASRARRLAGLGRRPSWGRSTDKMPRQVPSAEVNGANSASSACQASSASLASRSGTQLRVVAAAASFRWSANRRRPQGSLAESTWSQVSDPSGQAMLTTATPNPSASTIVAASWSSIETRSSGTVGSGLLMRLDIVEGCAARARGPFRVE